ncbi:MAG: hypothetical protein HYX92_00260 [Chloroflexi bacterium]|nr:hypothetical protein [Chloroflexota bacterium]
MDSEYCIDIAEICRSVDSAEVVSMYFPLLRRAVLVDFRSDSVEGPMVKVVPMVDSIEDRFRSLRRLRPRFARPESITVIPWPKYVRSLERLGIWDRIVQRLVASEHAAVVDACARSFNELLQIEAEELLNAIKGETYQSVWQSGHPTG